MAAEMVGQGSELEQDLRREEEFSVLGKVVPKYDSLEKVSGKAQYLIDLKLPGMLYGKILRSRYAHAKIISVDTRRAEELEGVVTVITAKDVPKIKFGFLKDNVALKDRSKEGS